MFHNNRYLLSSTPGHPVVIDHRRPGRRDGVHHCATGRRPLNIRVGHVSVTFRSFSFVRRSPAAHMRPATSRYRRPGSVAVAAAALPLLAACVVAAHDYHGCRLPDSLRAEIAGYRPVAERVLSYVRGAYRGRTWAALSVFVDTFGSRLAGTPNLENAIDYTLNTLKASRLDNVHAERVQFTGWQR